MTSGLQHMWRHLRPKRCLLSTQKRLISSHIPLADPNDKHGFDRDVASNVHWINLERHKALGPIYHEDLGPDVSAVWTKSASHFETILRNDGHFPRHVVPEAWRVYNERNRVQRGLFFMDGTQWWSLRRRINPVFMTAPHVEKAVDHASWVTDALLKKWEEQIEHDNEQGTSPSEILELEEQLSIWSLSFALSSLFGSNFESGVLEFGGLNALNDNVVSIFETSAQLQVLSAEKEAEKDSSLWREFSSAVAVALDTVKEMVLYNAPQCTDGLVHALRTEAGLEDMDQLSSLVSDLILAAADTTATSALWTLHKLSEQADLQNNISDCGLDNRLDLIKWSIRESMRLYPFAPFLTRILDNDLRLDENVLLPKHTLVLMSIFAAGRDEQYFENASKFWPQRWQRDESSKKFVGVNNAFASLPFGHGIRSCIGRRLAEEQLMHLVSEFFSRFQAQSLNENDVEMKLRLVGIPDKAIRIAISKRDGVR